MKPAIVRRRGACRRPSRWPSSWPSEGAPDRTVVIADHQTAGRGRRGARWEDEPGASLLMSIVLRPDLEPARLPMLSYVAAVAVAEALAAVAPVVPRLKWPNDVLVGGRKIAGILLETKLHAMTKVPGMTGRIGAPASSSRPPSAIPEHADPATTVIPRLATPPATVPATTILGIGVNLGQRHFPPTLAERATSVAMETGRAVDRETLLAALLDRFDVWRKRLEAEGFDVVRQRWIALSDTIGRRISVAGQVGIALDLDEHGALVLETGNGRQRVVAGETREPCCS